MLLLLLVAGLLLGAADDDMDRLNHQNLPGALPQQLTALHLQPLEKLPFPLSRKDLLESFQHHCHGCGQEVGSCP